MGTNRAISRWLVVAAVFGGLAVASGAFGAHWLQSAATAWPEDNRARRLENWETGSRYQMYHALALAALGVYLTLRPSRLGQAAAWSFSAGIAIFSGCLYAYCLTGVRAWGAVVPIGGVLMIIGWALWAADALRGQRDPHRNV